MKAGAADFVSKPWTNQHMLQTVQTALGLAASPVTSGEPAPSRDDMDARFDFGDLLGSDPRFDATALQTVGVKGWDGVAIALVV